LIYSTYDTRLR